MIKRILSSYPLFVKDPYFSIWADGEELNNNETVFWTGQKSPVLGLIHANGRKFCFMGIIDGAEKLVQTNLAVGTFNTAYKFECDLFEMEADFISPLPPDDLELLSSPVCYFSYKIKPRVNLEKFSIALILKQEVICDGDENIRGGVVKIKDKEVAWYGLAKQKPLSHVGDNIKAEWGYYYVSADKARYLTQDGFNGFLNSKKIKFEKNEGQKKNILAYDEYKNVSKNVQGIIIVAMDDTVSINYFGEWLKGYYFRNGKTIFQAIAEGFENFNDIKTKLEKIECSLAQKTEKYGKGYLNLLNASFRQVMAGHKIVENRKGELLYLSKECYSNGCIATADVSFPSFPMFLLYNPKLARAMLIPIFEFARKEIWEYGFAPHDVGTYPYCCGQTYGLNHKINDFLCDGTDIDWKKKQTFPPIYDFPKGCNIYDDARQMPVEESGNMIIMSYAAAVADGDTVQLKNNFDLLEKWAYYLLDKGLFPENQLCTDDFTGHIEENINLSAKTIVALKAFSEICRMLNKNNMAEKFGKYALEFANTWEETAWTKDKSHTKLSYDSEDDTFSLKYNIVIDILMDMKLFDKNLLEKEFDFYLSKLNRYGIPLDSRNGYTKSDWLIWICLFTDDNEKRKKIIDALYDYLTSSPNRVPFCDWYDTISGKQMGFQNRTVQGGLFILLLNDEKILRGQANG